MLDKFKPPRTAEVHEAYDPERAQNYADHLINEAWHPISQVTTDPELSAVMAASAMALEQAHFDDPNYPKATDWLNINKPEGQIFRRAAAHYIELYTHGDAHFTVDRPVEYPGGELHQQNAIAFIASNASLQRTANRVLTALDDPAKEHRLSAGERAVKVAAKYDPVAKAELKQVAAGNFRALDAESQKSFYENLTGPIQNPQLRRSVGQQVLHLEDIARRHRSNLDAANRQSQLGITPGEVPEEAHQLAKEHFGGTAPKDALRYNQRHALNVFAELSDFARDDDGFPMPQAPDIRAAARFIHDTQHTAFDVSDAVQSMFTDRHLQCEGVYAWQDEKLERHERDQAEKLAKGQYHLLDQSNAERVHIDLVTSSGASILDKMQIAVSNEGISNETQSEVGRGSEAKISKALYAASMAQQMSM